MISLTNHVGFWLIGEAVGNIIPQSSSVIELVGSHVLWLPTIISLPQLLGWWMTYGPVEANLWSARARDDISPSSVHGTASYLCRARVSFLCYQWN